MATRSRRKARETALRVLYEVEVGQIEPKTALTTAIEELSLPDELATFATALVEGVLANQAELDIHLAHLIREFAYDRVATVDRNVMRIAAFELFHMPTIPPAVSLNEAIEIAKKYSTVESGKFVNGVLGQLLLISPKAIWDPAKAPIEVEERGEPEPPMEVEDVPITPKELKHLERRAGWVVRSEDQV